MKYNSLLIKTISTFHKLIYHSTSKAVLILMSGAFVSQALTIVSSPILTRIYSPSDFGEFAIFTSILSILLVFSTGRYDLSVFEPKLNTHSKILIQSSFVIISFFSLLLLIIVFLFNSELIKILGNKEINDYVFVFPLSVFIASALNLVNSWSNRLGHYNIISNARIISTVLNILLSVLIGFFYSNVGVLIFSLLVGQLASLFILRSDIPDLFTNFSKKKSIILTKKYKEYPFYLIPATLSSEISGALPIILFTKYFGLETTGYFVLALKITTAPVAFLSNAIGEVYRQKAGEVFGKIGNCKELYLKTIKKLLLIAIPSFLFILIFSNTLFPILFGRKWEISGYFVQCLSVMVFFQIISSPLSYTIVFNKSQKIDMFLQFYRLIFSFGAIYLGYFFNSSTLSVLGYSFIFSTYYIFHSILQYKASIGLSKSSKHE